MASESAAVAETGTEPEHRPSAVRQLMWWAIILIALLLLLVGRFDWSPEVRSYAWRGYLSSAYLLVVFLPTLFYLLLFITGAARPTGVTTVLVGLLCALPYRWLGLDSAADEPPGWWPAGHAQQPEAALDFLPEGLHALRGMPHELAFFATLIVLGGALGGIALLRAGAIAENEKGARRRRVALLLGVFLLITIQTWLHLSMRSPATYMPHLAEATPAKTWFHAYLFAEGGGAVAGDYPTWRDLELHFAGTPHETSALLIRRSFPFFLSSQLSHFVNPYYVWLLLNMATWWVAAAATYWLMRRLWDERVGTYATLLVGCGSGFIVFAAQPTGYLVAYAALLLVVAACELILVEPRRRSFGDYLLFGTTLSLATLTYDIFPTLVFLFFYLWVRLRSLWPSFGYLLSVAVAVSLYAGFLLMQRYALDLPFDARSSEYLASSVENIWTWLSEPSLRAWYLRLSNCLGQFAVNVLRAFLVLPAVAAMLALFFRRREDRVDVAFLFWMPALIGFSFLYLGQTWFADRPQFVYSAYPAVYALAGIFLAWLWQQCRARNMPVLAEFVPAFVIAVAYLLSNIDAFGHPQMYFLFLYGNAEFPW